MTSVERLLHDAVLADVELGPILGTRFYAVQLPIGPTYPCATYQRVSTNPLYVQGPPGNNQASVGWCRFQITGWFATASGYSDALAFFQSFMDFMQRFSAYTLPGSPVVLGQAPNFLLGFRIGIEPQITTQPIIKAILDVKVYYQNQ